ncbi:MAG: hypothetical protein HY907_13170 [Deltaproteobacteria bacterium]|nr:hypothetical protein [Deltaproteobacteria bacterium]
MRKRSSLAVFLCVSALAASAQANPMDLTLSRLYRDRETCDLALRGIREDPVTGDPIGPDNVECADQAAFRELSREFGLAIAPVLLAPAETLGYAGFYLGLEGSITLINKDNGVWARAVEDGNPDGALTAWSIHARKGLPFSFELGTSVSYLAATEDVLLGADVRWALLEGYRSGWKAYFPDLAVRGAVNRLMGDDEMDMTVWSIDVSLSHPFAISGAMTITPYAGYQFVQTIADTALVLNGMDDDTGHPRLECNPELLMVPDETTPDPTDLRQETVGEAYQRACVGGVNGPPGLHYLEFSREYIDRHRGFIGVRFLWEHFVAILQAAFTDGQQNFGVSLGFDY